MLEGYSVRFYVTVRRRWAAMTSDDVTLEYGARLPFVPVEGMTYEEGDLRIPIGSVVWDQKKQMFFVYLPPDSALVDECKDEGGRPPNDWQFNKEIDRFLDYGWQRRV